MFNYKKFVLIAFNLALFLCILQLIPQHVSALSSVDRIAHRDRGANGATEDPDAPTVHIKDVFPPFTTNIGTLITGINYRFDSIQDWVTAFSGAQKQAQTPLIDLGLEEVAQPGHLTKVLGQPINFQSLFSDQYYNWCLGTFDKRIIQNGVLAGGTLLRMTDPGNGTDCYSRVTRSVAKENDTDANHDGIGDAWARRYFGTSNIKALEDADRDGFALTPDNSIIGPDGVINVIPDSFSEYHTLKSCDGTFSNAEEYIWGTNPVDPDSDDDGYGDEEDICGHAQLTFPYVIPEATPTSDKSFFVEVITVGVSAERDQNGEKRLVKIANSGRTFFYNNGVPLVGTLNYRNLNAASSADTKENVGSAVKEVYVGDKLEFRADITQSRAREANLHYQWTFQLLDGGVDHPNEPTKVLDTIGPLPKNYGIDDATLGRNGYSLNPYRLWVQKAPVTSEEAGFPHVVPKTGNIIRVKVYAIEPETGKSVTLTSEISISLSISLDFLPSLPVFPLIPGASKTSAALYTVNANTTGLNPNDYLFQWYIDDELQSNAHVGGATVKFPAVKSSGSYRIRLVMNKVADGKKLADVSAVAPVQSLSPSIVNCAEFQNKTDIHIGSRIALLGRFDTTGSFPGDLEYQWYLNGQPASEAGPDAQSMFVFIPQAVGEHTIAYSVHSVPPEQAGGTVYTPFEMSGNCVISVVAANQGVALRFGKALAEVYSQFPQFVRTAAAYAVVLLAVFGAFLGIRWYIRRPRS